MNKLLKPLSTVQEGRATETAFVNTGFEGRQGMSWDVYGQTNYD